MSEFRYNPDLKVGDEVEVYIESQEDKKGQLILSHKMARATRSWDRVNTALEGNEIIKGYIKCRTKGGMIVDVFGIEAFLPGSQIDVKPIRDYDVFVGKTMEFKVVKINHEFKNVVVSHKALIEAELEAQKKDIISKLEKGQVLEGTVKNIHIFNTEIITFDNKTVFIPNGGMSTNVVVNFNNRETRRIDLTIGLDYGTDFDLAKSTINEIIQSDKRILPEPASYIALKNLGQSTVDTLIRVWVNTSDYWDVYFNLNEQIYKIFAQKGIGLAFPQMTVHLAQQ
jgi:hypothetical protein